MLVLSRQKDEIIRIGDDIAIVVVEIRGHEKVRLGIEAPKYMPVHRQEVYEAIERDGNVRPQDTTVPDELDVLSWRELREMAGSAVAIFKAMRVAGPDAYNAVMSWADGMDDPPASIKRLREAVER